jgi:nickel/cobalt transporter (NicO) family protein
MSHRLWLVLGLVSSSLGAPAAWPHDIPNQRVDRSMQVWLEPGRIRIDYEVSLTELTLTQDLRALIGTLPGADRSEWLAQYARVTGPLDAKGILVSIDKQPVGLSFRGHDLAVEEHPRYTFHLESPIPERGTLSIRDTNYATSEGTSRLAVRGRDGVTIQGDDLPADVNNIPIRPVWQLSDDEERRTKQVEVHYRVETGRSIHDSELFRNREIPLEPTSPNANGRLNRISQLLDQRARVSWLLMALIALGLGAAHAVQPGHGKTLVTAVALSPDARLYQAVILGLATTLAHMGSVLLIAVGLWYTGATQVGSLHRGLSLIAGFVIAAAGFWRIGRHLGGYGEHSPEEFHRIKMSNLGVVGLGLVSGLVPCWDAVGLLVLAAALGRLATGVALVIAFSGGMAAVLVAVAWFAGKMKSISSGINDSANWQRRLGLVCGVMLAAIGLYLFFE